MSFVVGQRTLSFFTPVRQKYTLESQCPTYNNEESQCPTYNNEDEQLGKAFTDDEMFLTIPANIMQQ